jgi:hypothetical protein
MTARLVAKPEVSEEQCHDSTPFTSVLGTPIDLGWPR